MPQALAYLILAQLNTLMTGSLRLALDFLGLAALSGLVGWKRPAWKPLSGYFGAWALALALLGLGFSAAETLLLPQPNPFVRNGLVLSLLLSVGLGGWILLARRLPGPKARLGLSALAGSGLLLALMFPAFSRSNQVVYACLLNLPLALALGFFPLNLLSRARPALREGFHATWLLAAPLSLLIHHAWLWPQLSRIPQQGEFYPYLNLYDWFLMAAMILYSGNLYIDYWLKLGDRRSILALSWNYLVLVVAILCLWLNANVFDTLAL